MIINKMEKVDKNEIHINNIKNKYREYNSKKINNKKLYSIVK